MSQNNLSKFSKAFNEAMKRLNEIQRKNNNGKGEYWSIKKYPTHQIYWQRYRSGLKRG